MPRPRSHPGLFAATDMTAGGAFELRLNDRVLGTASLSPVPPATLNAEGGFKPPPNFTWTTAAEEECSTGWGGWDASGESDELLLPTKRDRPAVRNSNPRPTC